MKILVTNHWLRKLGGSETFTYALIQELMAQGHELSLFTIVPGMVSDLIANKLGVKRELKNPDLILANHHTTVEAVSHLAPTIQTCHGIYPRLEQPSPKAHAYVGISEEVCKHVRTTKGHTISLIHNGINLERFSPVNPLNTTIRKVLSLSHSIELNHQLQKIFAGYGIEFRSLNKLVNPLWDIPKAINEVDMVVSLGRGVYEAMACGRPVLCVDKRPYSVLCGDGPLKDTFDKSLYNNCSGRALQRTDLENMVKEAIFSYRPSDQDFFRNLAISHFDIKKQVHQYQQLWKKLI